MNRGGILVLLAALFAATHAGAQVMRPVLSFPREYTASVTIDDAGTAIYAVSSSNQFGTNPDYLKQIVRWDPLTGTGAPITDFEEGVTSVSVSDDGAWLAFVSRADLLGTNRDESPELYVMHPDGTGIAQLTSGSFLPLRDRGVHGAVISGSANRVTFVGRIDPLGTNPTLKSALFVIDRDGTNLRQLAVDVRLASDSAPTGYRPGPGLGISDDGSRIVYITGTGSWEIAGINADGTGRHVFSSTTGAADVVISGNGAKIAYATGGLLNHSVRTRAFDGNPFTIVFLSTGEGPAITDDANFVYLYRYASGPTVAGIWKMPLAGGGATLISPGLQIAGVSGSGNRIAARGTELLSLDDAGGSLQQLTTTTVAGEFIDDLSFSPDASTLYFSSRMDPLGTNPARDYEQFAFALGTGQFTQLTDGSLPSIGWPSFSDTGTIVFEDYADLTGQNPCAGNQVFRLDPGGPLTQLTNCGSYDFNGYVTVSGDGQVVAFLAYGDSTPLGAFSIQGDGTGRTHLTNLGNAFVDDRKVFDVGSNGTPTWVAFSGVVAGNTYQVYRVRSDGTDLQQLTTGTLESHPPTISGDGDRLAWISRSNYTGQNADASFEAFAFDIPTATFRQLTHDDEAAIGNPRVTRDGSHVFLADSRYDMGTSTLEPATGPHRSFELYPDATGSRWLIHVYDRLDNAPGSQSFFLADMTVVPSFSVAKASPTELSWDPSPTSLRYDAIRGSIANLSMTGSTVSLGPVTCLEDDSPDSHTNGHGDPAEPAPGEAFFFLYRGSIGFAAAAGSYGHGTGGKDRLPSSGGCSP